MNLKEVDLLLIGKTGSGKSSTGNSILKRNMFKSSYSANSCTKFLEVHYAEYKDFIIKVVDGPGVFDTELSEKESVTQITRTMTNAITVNTLGYHAFLVVVKLGERFTKECQLTIDVLKGIFGEHFLKFFGVLVVSNGDNFNEENSKSFETWCSTQESFFHDLLLECGSRAVLFDNKTEDEQKKDQQLNKLLDIVQTLKGDGLRYTCKYFQFAQDERAKAWELEVCERTLKEASLIIQSLGKFDTVDQETIHSFLKLQSRAEDLLSNVVQYNPGTVALARLIEYVQVMKGMIQEYISRVGHAQEIQGEVDQLQAQSLSKNDNIPTDTEIIPMEIEVNQEIDTGQENSLTGTKMAELNIYMKVTYTKLEDDHIEVTRKTVAEYLMLIGDTVFQHVTNNFSFKNII